jgi:hypothetical protein
MQCNYDMTMLGVQGTILDYRPVTIRYTRVRGRLVTRECKSKLPVLLSRVVTCNSCVVRGRR